MRCICIVNILFLKLLLGKDNVETFSEQCCYCDHKIVEVFFFFFIFKSSSPDEIQASAQNYGSSTKFLYQRSTHTVEFVCLLVRSARFAVVFSPCGALTTLSVY